MLFTILLLLAPYTTFAVNHEKPYDDGVCGRTTSELKVGSDDDLRITSGIEAIPHSQPWVAYIEYGPDKCGAVIIPSLAANSSDYLLTAELCVEEAIYKGKSQDVRVLAGVHDLAAHDEAGRQLGQVEKIYVEDEIAIIKLKTPLKFTDQVKSACLTNNYYLQPKTKCLASGWGATEGGVAFQTSPFSVPSVKMPTKLMTVTLIAHSETFCSMTEVSGSFFKFSKHLCAGDLFGKKGINNYDAGGPLMCYEDGVWTLYGIAKARGFYHESKPSFFSKVHHYSSLIKDITGIKYM